jgi:hypothetical protein
MSLKIPCTVSVCKMWLWYTPGRDLCWPFRRARRYDSDISFLSYVPFILTSCFLFNSGGLVCNITTEILVCCCLWWYVNNHDIWHVLSEESRLVRWFPGTACPATDRLHLFTATRWSWKGSCSRTSSHLYSRGVCFESWPGRLIARLGSCFFLAWPGKCRDKISIGPKARLLNPILYFIDHPILIIFWPIDSMTTPHTQSLGRLYAETSDTFKIDLQPNCRAA